MENHLSVTEMHKRLEVTRDMYYKIEVSKVVPNIGILRKMQDLFSVSMDWLLFNRGSKALSEKSNQNGALLLQTSGVGEINQVISLMESDLVFRHEILGHYYRYKNEKA